MEEYHKGYTIKIQYDDCSDNPREAWDNLGVILAQDSFANEVDTWVKDEVREDFNNGVDIEKSLAKHFGEIALVLPVYKYSHGCSLYSTGSFIGRAHHAAWDSSQTGFIFVTKEAARKRFGRKRITQTVLDQINDCLVGEIKYFSAYANGDVYGFNILDDDGESVDSCWGFYDYDECVDYAKEEIDMMVKRINEAPETRAPIMALLS